MLKTPKTKHVKTKKLNCKTTFWKLKKYILQKCKKLAIKILQYMKY